MDLFKLRYICENCGKIDIFNNEEEAFNEGWDYPPRIGEYRVIGPRTCGNCAINTTLYWEIITGKVKSINDMTSCQKEIFIRILGEPETIFIEKD